jgi:hypothetical protein
MAGRDSSPALACTFDLHEVDLPEDIVCSAEWFRDSGRVATFFVPSAMLQEARYADALRRLPCLGHEVASHGHHHDWAEIESLMSGAPERLGFLAESRDRHAQFFGEAPTSFRSPRWCTLATAAIRELRRLGYVADSSATPQRFPPFSSTPFHPGWWACPRRIHELEPGLVEIPTSTLLAPAGAPTFLTLRSAGSRLFLALLESEARAKRDLAIVLQFHVEDFSPASRRVRTWGRPSWRDFVPRSRGGFGLKLFLRDTDPARIVRTHRGIVERFGGLAANTITALARAALARRDGRQSR